MRTYEHTQNLFIIILALLLLLITASPAMAAFGNPGNVENGQHSMGNDDINSSGVSSQGKVTQTTLTIIYGLFLVVVILVAVILFIIFAKKRRIKLLKENKKTDLTENTHRIYVSEERRYTSPNFPTGLNSKYSDVHLIGTGGLSYVFSGKSRETDETVAIKIPILKDEKSGSVFLQEIKIWEGLSHANIVSVKSVNVFPVPYVEMEYIPDSLSDLKVPLKPDIALHIAAGVLRGLSYAHNKGIIHCDIKPGNILIDGDFNSKITDWGVGKHIGVISGVSGYTPAFAAPEQITADLKDKCTVRTDIYQTGMLLYWMLSGKTAFEEDFYTKKQSGDEVIPDKSLSESGDEKVDYVKYSEINKIVLKCIQNDPYMRYSNADELLSAILSIFSSTIIG